MWIDIRRSFPTNTSIYLILTLFILSLTDDFAFARVAKTPTSNQEINVQKDFFSTNPDFPGTTSNGNLEDRSLILKRGCAQSTPQNAGGNGVPATWLCDSLIPGVDECNTQIQQKGNVGAKTSLFYTGSPNGQASCRQWASCNLPADSWVLWSGICDMAWYFDTTRSIERPFGPQGQNLPAAEVSSKSDPYPKNLSQAFAEQSKGRTYLCIPKDQVTDDQSWNPASAWGGWEYPALTRNKGVPEIWRVDPNDPTSQQGMPRQIWQTSDGHSPQAPLGTRGTSLPVGLPDADMPPNWQSSP